MAKHEVETLIGRPDWAAEMFAKESRRHVGTSWTYLLSSGNVDLVNELGDERIEVFFNPDGRVVKIAAGQLVEPGEGGE